ncbi:ComEC/Rec2 family competence protein [Streptomyces sp. NPDC060243]|uniref:ComEC/Rec2 family competence protein n=1 Tax=Streptomyces sp. NPDC060243 TaxID=3347081 RepID=UPI00365A0CD8
MNGVEQRRREEAVAGGAAGAGRDRRACASASGEESSRQASSRPSDKGADRPEGVDLRLVLPALGAWGAAALVLGLSARAGVWIAGVCGVFGGALLLGGRAGRRRWTGHGGARRRWVVAAVLVCVGAGAASAAVGRADIERGPVPGLVREGAVTEAVVEVTAEPRARPSAVRGGRELPGQLLWEGEAREIEVRGGRVVRVRTPVLVVVDGLMEPGREKRAREWLRLLPTTRVRARFRWTSPWARGQRAAAVARVHGEAGPVVAGQPSRAQRLAGELRDGLRGAVAPLHPDARALLPGLVVGDTSGLTPELERVFQATDLTHLLAVSGGNFAVLLALLLGPPGRAALAERGGLAPRLGLSLRGTAAAGGVLCAGFVVVCGAEPSVVRAAGCGTVALVALATGRRRSMVPALAAVVLVLVLWEPWLARSYGFVLSVLATGALLTVAPSWSAVLRRRGLSPRLAEGLAAAAAAQAVCAPVVVLLSERVSLVAVPCNLLAGPLVAPATVLGFGALALAPLGQAPAQALAWCAGWPVRWVAGVARAGAALPGSGIAWPGGWAGAGLLAGAVLVLVPLGRMVLRSRWLVCGCALLLVLAVVRPVPVTRVLGAWPPTGWRFVMCDVGQGDATVLAAGAETAVVVDAGPEPDRVAGCLDRLGVRRVPLVLLSHFHADHVAGLEGVLRGRAVGAVQTTALAEPAGQAAAVRRTAAEHGVPVLIAAAGERRKVGGVSWEVVWPPAGGGPVGDDGPNDASLVLSVRTGGVRLLLAGDVEPAVQRELLRRPGGAPHVDVLKVPHHGSAYQEGEWVRRVAPRVALVSVGADNGYGHPAPRTLDALRATGALVERTDQHGDLAVTGGPSAGRDRVRDGEGEAAVRLGVARER